MSLFADIGRSLGRLSGRERVLILGAAFAVLLLAWNYLVLVPLEARRAAAVEQRERLQNRMAVLQTEQADMVRRMTRDPNRAARERIALLERRLADQEEAIGRRMQRFIQPSDMAGLLRDLLEADGGLRLQRLETLTPEVVVEGDTAADGPLVYRHGLLLEFKGGYGETLRYLERVERVAGMLGWDRLEIRVERYPMSLVRIRVHTLSTRREALGV